MMQYFDLYGTHVFYTCLYSVCLATVGFFYFLRKNVLLGLVMAQTSKLGFILAFVVSGVNVYELINSDDPSELGRMLFQLDPFFFLFTAMFLLPIFWLMAVRPKNKESNLSNTFIIYTALVPLIIKAAEGTDDIVDRLASGDPLLTNVSTYQHYAMYVVPLTILFVILHRQMLLVSFDPRQAKVAGHNSRLTNILFYVITGVILASSVRVLGVLISAIMLLVPATVSLTITRRYVGVLILTPIMTTLLTLGSYMISFSNPSLPAESILVNVIGWGGFLTFIIALVYFRYRK